MQSMTKANEIKRGAVIRYNGKLLVIKDIEVQSPSARGASTLYKIRFSTVQTGLKIEERFKGDDILEEVQLMKRPVSLCYINGDEYHFMDDENFTPYLFSKAQIAEELLFIPSTGLAGMAVIMVEEQIIGLELPQTVCLTIVATTPALKGASSSARTKPATLSTGLIVQVPEYINTGDKIKIHIGERRYMNRADS